ncbi:TcdA/TcdB catalytic glycosyltransferase domain-containing protein [Burkholderia plantarii]|uniref:TcdA/TcdB catalytic glycosyltransferase domain-containing protein n=1 Tax=Burkholderia plantarii TaxID=41899 RepID=UPI0006D8AB3B|nr:TcdA/TcdB catalytic glycosyltransferase domain-containing protein [Burkholderia plantarii]ALK32600.1 glycosyltransferase sugar-binding region containing DXD motif protein [Burkholderia plantarii]GLZ19973.1 hypothetical protein Bpla01_35020 [Burkholderia plantarii]
MKAIPKVIHIIWIGGDIPQRNRECITTFVRHNPDWKIRLWIDANQLLTGERRRQVKAQHGGSVSKEAWQAVAERLGSGGDAETIRYLASHFDQRGEALQGLRLRQINSIMDFCRANGITLSEVQRDLKTGKNAAIYRQELVNRGANFGSASDILRIEILLQYGGIYVDTDVDCVSALGELICHQSYPRFSAVSALWANGVTEQDWNSDAWWKQRFNGQMAPKISNSIIACHAGSKGLKAYRKLIAGNFTKLRRDDEMRGAYFDSIRSSTIQMTGPTAAADSTGFNRAREAAKHDGDEFSDQRKLDLRDHWYFPMHHVRDRYFHDWL